MPASPNRSSFRNVGAACQPHRQALGAFSAPRMILWGRPISSPFRPNVGAACLPRRQALRRPLGFVVSPKCSADLSYQPLASSFVAQPFLAVLLGLLFSSVELFSQMIFPALVRAACLPRRQGLGAFSAPRMIQRGRPLGDFLFPSSGQSSPLPLQIQFPNLQWSKK
jgi:hypothetical protein